MWVVKQTRSERRAVLRSQLTRKWKCPNGVFIGSSRAFQCFQALPVIPTPTISLRLFKGGCEIFTAALEAVEGAARLENNLIRQKITEQKRPHKGIMSKSIGYFWARWNDGPFMFGILPIISRSRPRNCPQSCRTLEWHRELSGSPAVLEP